MASGRPSPVAKRQKMATARGLLCISVSEKSKAAALALLKGQEMGEIRIDLMYPEVGQEDLKEIFAAELPLIATCRDVEGDGGSPSGFENFGPIRRELLLLGITSGATHVDVEMEAPAEWRAEMIAAARKHDVTVIISHHNYSSTPSVADLQAIVDVCFEYGADIAKIAVAAKSTQDAARVLSLFDQPRPIVALAMGEAGKITRLAGPLLGGAFSFVAATDESATAPGQLTGQQMLDAYAAASL